MNKNTIFLLFFLIIFDINPLKQSINIKIIIILNKKIRFLSISKRVPKPSLMAKNGRILPCLI